MAAETIAIDLIIDVAKSAKNIKDVKSTLEVLNAAMDKVEEGGEAFKKLEKQVKASNESLVAMTVSADKSNMTLRELEESAELLNEQLLDVERGSVEFEKLSQALRDTNTELKNTELSLEALDSEQVASELGGVAGAVGDVTAAFVLMGGEGNETLEEMAGRIQSAIGIAVGFKGAIEGIQSGLKLWRNFNTIIKQSNTLMKAQAVAQGVYNFVVSKGNVIQKAQIAIQAAAAAGMAVLNAIMNLNPVFLLITAFAALAGAMAWLTSSTEVAEEANEKLNKTMEREQRLIDETINKQRKLGEQRLKVAQLTGAAEDELHQIRLDNLATEEKARKLQIKKELADIQRKRTIYKQALKEENEELAKSTKEEIQTSRSRYRELLSQNGDYQRAKQIENLEFTNFQKQQEEEQTRKEQQELEKRQQAWRKQREKRQQEEKQRIEELDKFEEEIFQKSLATDEERAQRKLSLEFEANMERAKRLIKDEEKLQETLTNLQKLYLAELDKRDQSQILKEDEKLKKIVELNKKANASLDLIEAEQALQDAENIKDDIEREKARNEALKQLDNARIAQLELNRDLALDDEKLTEDQRKELIEKTELEISKIRQRERDVNKAADEKAALEREELNKQLVDAALSTVQTLSDATFEILANARAKQFEAQTEAMQQQFEFQNDQLDRSVELGINTQRVADRKRKKLEKKQRAEKEALDKKAFEADKKAKIKQAVINGALAITQVFASTPPPASFILAGAQAVATGAQIGVISSQKFRRGGVLQGPSHEQGGIKTSFGEFEGGEAVINKKSTRMFREQLSAINQAGGGVKFAQGGILPERNSTSNGNGSDLNGSINRLNELLSDPLRAYIPEEDLESATNKRKALERNSNL